MGCAAYKKTSKISEATMSLQSIRINKSIIKKFKRLSKQSSLATIFEVSLEHEQSLLW